MRHWKKKPWVDSEVRNWDYIADHLAPDATSADAGKVLTVGETGKPEWGEGGGSGGGAMYLVITEDGGDYTYNYTSSEIRNALINHTPIYLSKMVDGGYSEIIPMTFFLVTDELWGVTFMGITSYTIENASSSASIILQEVQVYDAGDGINTEITTSNTLHFGGDI